MDGVKSFYDKQHQWANVYACDVAAYHRDKAESIGLPEREAPYRILELGCGGVQMTAALADLGHSLVAIDLNPAAIRNAHRLAAARPHAQITLIEGDFYALALQGNFDVVCYFDGFGIGSDADQRQLLHRIASWLTEGGRAFIEIYTPWYWARMDGVGMEWPDASRRYGFDEASCRMLDTWWPPDRPEEAVTQSLRCYSPEGFSSLLNGTGLGLMDIRPGGAIDSQTGEFQSEVPLEAAMQYAAILTQL
ncbi:class I SAM-dependent methyltransferase [Candidatus Bipolaricaulota bacterium]